VPVDRFTLVDGEGPRSRFNGDDDIRKFVYGRQTRRHRTAA
jgi:hypothetical protein